MTTTEYLKNLFIVSRTFINIFPFSSKNSIALNILRKINIWKIYSLRLFNAQLRLFFFRYQRRAKEVSQRFRDRPLSPLDTAIYWIEYVIKHKGAFFMQTAAVKMPLYQYLLLDVIAFLLVFVISILSILYFVFSNLYILFSKTFFKKKKLEWFFRSSELWRVILYKFIKINFKSHYTK